MSLQEPRRTQADMSLRAAVVQGAMTKQEIIEAAQRQTSLISEKPLPTNSFISTCNTKTQAVNLNGSLAGSFFAVKDNIDLKGETTTSGAAPFAHHQADATSPVVEQLLDSGALCVGKSNMHEFALGATNENRHFGDVLNPWNTEMIPGGSSGGSAAAVATGDVHFALGTDSGGSVRIPASMCGVVGYKPTGGRLPTEGIEGAAWTIDSYGILTRTVDDLIPIAQALRIEPANSSEAEKVRIGYLSDDSMGLAAADVWKDYKSQIETLKKAGLNLNPISLPGFDTAPYVCVAIAYPEISSQHYNFIRQHAGDYGDDIRPLIQLGSLLGAQHYLTAQRTRRAMKERFENLTQNVDVVCMPTVAVSPTKHGEESSVPGDDQDRALFTLMRFTVLFNVIGGPALSLPGGMSETGLPRGLQVAGRAGTDKYVLATAKHIEDELGMVGLPPVNRA